MKNFEDFSVINGYPESEIDPSIKVTTKTGEVVRFNVRDNGITAHIGEQPVELPDNIRTIAQLDTLVKLLKRNTINIKKNTLSIIPISGISPSNVNNSELEGICTNDGCIVFGGCGIDVGCIEDTCIVFGACAVDMGCSNDTCTMFGTCAQDMACANDACFVFGACGQNMACFDDGCTGYGACVENALCFADGCIGYGACADNMLCFADGCIGYGGCVVHLLCGVDGCAFDACGVYGRCGFDACLLNLCGYDGDCPADFHVGPCIHLPYCPLAF